MTQPIGLFQGDKRCRAIVPFWEYLQYLFVCLPLSSYSQTPPKKLPTQDDMKKNKRAQRAAAMQFDL